LVVLGIGMIYGSIMEERKLRKINPEYEEYTKKVKARFIPFLI
jgi:protein-S-isoprenylcysteine O-methyltransferase Ste14